MNRFILDSSVALARCFEGIPLATLDRALVRAANAVGVKLVQA